MADVEPRAPRRAHVEAPAFAAGDDGERGRQIGAGALLLVLLEHDGVEGAAPLVEGVEALAEADDVLVGVETEGEARPHRSVGGDQPLDRFRDEPIDVAVGGQLAALRCPTPGQHREPLGRTGDEVGAPHEAVAERLVRCGRQHGSPDRQLADVGAGAARSGEVTIGVGGRRVQAVEVDGRERDRFAAVGQLDRDGGDADGYEHSQLQRLAGDRVHGVALIGIDAVWVAAAERAVGDGRDFSHRAT